MLKRRYTYQLRAIDYRKKQALDVLQETKKAAMARNVANSAYLERLERNKDEIFAKIDRLDRRMERFEKKVEWLEEIVPTTHDLLQKIHTHFEKLRSAQTSEVKQFGSSPENVIVKSKGDKKS